MLYAPLESRLRRLSDFQGSIHGNFSPSGVRTSAPNSPALSAIDWIALVLMIIGGINCGLVGLLNFDLVAAIFGHMSTLSRVVYVLVGLAALYGIALATWIGRRV